MDVERDTFCKNKFSKNVTRANCCCTGVGVAYSSKCRLCPKQASSKRQTKRLELFCIFPFIIFLTKMISTEDSVWDKIVYEKVYLCFEKETFLTL